LIERPKFLASNFCLGLEIRTPLFGFPIRTLFLSQFFWSNNNFIDSSSFTIIVTSRHKITRKAPKNLKIWQRFTHLNLLKISYPKLYMTHLEEAFYFPKHLTNSGGGKSHCEDPLDYTFIWKKIRSMSLVKFHVLYNYKYERNFLLKKYFFHMGFNFFKS
jgi:hypothetical protein